VWGPDFDNVRWCVVQAEDAEQMTEPAHARRGSGTKMAAVQDSEKLGNRAEADALGALKIQYCELPAVRIWSYTSHECTPVPPSE
jgi:hypothetical protein